MSRVSVTHNALSDMPLHPSHVIVDCAGNLFKEDALLHYVLSRQARKWLATPKGYALAHIQSINHDMARVQCGADELGCRITHMMPSEGGGLASGWSAGV